MITASIVLYNNEPSILIPLVNEILNQPLNVALYLIDNSSDDNLKQYFLDQRITYIHNPSNPGFGAAHNLAINKAISIGSRYHFVVNPDIYFQGNVISTMVEHLENNPNIGMMMPEILYPDGRIQNLPKLLPSPFSILFRKLRRPSSLYDKFIDRYELRFVPRDTVYKAPILSGCFTLLNLKAIKQIGAYDDEYFMYFEDWDLSRRMNIQYDTVYFPLVSVYHGYESGANKSSHLFKIYLKSYVRFFNKWGWFFDKERREINLKALGQFK